MRPQSMVLVAGLGVLAAACARRDQADLAADSARVADSLTAAAAASAGAGRSTNPAGRENLVTVTEATPGLLAQAKFIPIDAQHLAQTKFPEGMVKSGSIERRAGELVYTFEIQQKGVDGVELVLVNAMDGSILNTIHKDAAVSQNPSVKKP
jgi:uncharacterized membrane protein YkoI